MNKSSELILSIMRKNVNDLESGLKTLHEVDIEFLQQVSKKDLELCLIDESLDAEDRIACKDMLMYFFNHEVDLN